MLGCLLLDEMKLSESLSFQRSNLQVEGFVDLGKYSTDQDKTRLGDHALVLLYQPFCGKWFQTIGAFVGAGAVPGNILEKIVTEAVILLEQSNFHVDCITTDGATWNRSMWKLFGISEKSSSCIHPTDKGRKLWFASDFPHLIKNLKSRIINNKTVEVCKNKLCYKYDFYNIYIYLRFQKEQLIFATGKLLLRLILNFR